MRLDSLAVLGLFVLAACSSPPPASVKESPPDVEPIRSDNPTESVPLKVVMTDQTTSGRIMLVRGQIVNPLAQPVTGVRMQLVFVSPDGKGGGKVQDIQQKEFGTTIEPGGSVPFRWDVESMYAYGDSHFIVAAYPKRLGDRDMPPPDNWKD